MPWMHTAASGQHKGDLVKCAAKENCTLDGKNWTDKELKKYYDNKEKSQTKGHEFSTMSKSDYVKAQAKAQLGNISPAQLYDLKNEWPQGTRVVLVNMVDEPNEEMKPGLGGTVKYIDDAGTIHVSWDNGSGLGVIWGVDEIEKEEEYSDDYYDPDDEINAVILAERGQLPPGWDNSVDNYYDEE